MTDLSVFNPNRKLGSEVTKRGAYYRFDPSMSMVLGAYAHDAFSGQQTLAESLRAADAAFEKGELNAKSPVGFYTFLEKKITGAEPGKPMTVDEWRESEYYRDGLQYEPRMTNKLAEILAESHDREVTFGTIASRGSGLENAIGMGSSFVFGMAEPRNLAAGVGTAVALGGVHGFVAKAGHRTIQTAKRAKQLEKTIGKAGTVRRAVTEGLIGAAILEPGNWSNADALQKDYGMADSLYNIGLSVAASGAIQYGVNFYGKKRARAMSRREGLDASMAAISQVADGKRIDTSIVHDAYDIIIGREVPPPISEVQARQEIYRDNGEPDYVHDFFRQEAENVKQQYKEELDVDLNNPRQVESALGLKKFEAKTIKEVIKDLGGIVMDQDIRGRDISFKSYPGLFRKSRQQLHAEGKDISKAGNDIDQIIRTLKEKGFFPDKEEFEITKDDVIDALERDINGDRVYPEEIKTKIQDKLSSVNDLVKRYDEYGVSPLDSVDDIASALQAAYVETGTPIGKVYKDADISGMTKTPDNLLEKYTKDYEEWKDIDLYDSVDPLEYEVEAGNIKSDMNDIKDIDSDIDELELEFAEMKNAGLLDEADANEIDLINEAVDAMEDSREALKAGVFCLTRG